MGRGWLSKVFRRSPPEPAQRPGADDSGLEKFFTDAKEARETFDALLEAAQLPRRILVVHGKGAVGKTSLLRMYRLSSQGRGLPVALVAADDAHSAVDLLDRWSADLRVGRAPLPTFDAGLRRLRELHAKVEKKATGAEGADQLTRGVGRAAGVAAGLIPIPGIAPVAAALAPEAVEALLNMARALLAKDDYEFFTDPTRKLTDDFLADLARVAERTRPVLMLDALEQVTALNEWLRELIRALPTNALAVVAGHDVPDWGPAWPEWVASAELFELKEMTDTDVAELVRRYYGLFGRGEPDDEIVRDVVRFARGLPVAATTAVELGMTRGFQSLEQPGPDVIGDLAERLLRETPQSIRPALEPASVLRYFNGDSLGALIDDAPGGLYDELRGWPFTRPRREGLAVHEAIRGVIIEALRQRSPERFRQLHERAAAHYQRLQERASGEERDRLGREWLYHSLSADESTAIEQFVRIAEDFAHAQWIGRLRGLLNDANTYQLREERSLLWLRYYNARLEQLLGRTAGAEREFAAIGNSDSPDRRLRAYALCDLGTLLSALERLAQPDGERRAVAVVQRSLELQPALDPKLVANQITLMSISNARSAWAESTGYLDDARTWAEGAGDAYTLVLVDRLHAAVDGLQGDWRGYLDSRRRSLDEAERLGDVPALQMQILYFTWPLVFMGRYREAQESSEDALRLANRLEERELMITVLESAGLARGLQGDRAGSAEHFREAYNFFENFHLREAGLEAGAADRYIRATLSFRGLVAMREGRLDAAEADLQRALDIKREIDDRTGMPEMHVWRGRLRELRRDWDAASAEYENALRLDSVARSYFHCEALAGLVRVRAAQGREAEVAPLAAAAEELALRYEYNDVLASLRLSQGHLAGDDDAALACYEQALVHALRFNRFLLDEALAGREAGTVLRPVIPACLERDARLLDALGAWWQAATNDVGAETVSPLAPGATLVDAEREARAREPGPGDAQRTVVEQLRSAAP
jgi:tetratricopeptide (TPR) repeat protein